MDNVHQLSKVDQLRRVNKAELAQLFDVSVQAVDGWIRRGCPAVDRGGRNKQWVFDVVQIAEWRYSGRSVGGDFDPESLMPAERKQWYEGETRRRDLQIRDRELIPASEVESAVAQGFASLAQAIQSLPDVLEQDSSLTPEQAEAAENSLHAALNAIADQLSTLAPVGIE